MNVSDYTTRKIAFASWVLVSPPKGNIDPKTEILGNHPPQGRFDLLQPLRNWLDNVAVNTPEMAHLLCQLIPAQCPFERDVKLFGKVLFHIPPMCKLNPLYEELVGLRFRALCYLADQCHEDISRYC